ncbi:MAG: hydroxyethylthiazole kinase [Eubacterium sp.]
MLERYMEYVREKTPLIHTITNAVTINDVANMLFACGARPLMSDDPVDIEEITAFTDGLVLNLGMLNPHKLEGMFLAGEKGTGTGAQYCAGSRGSRCEHISSACGQRNHGTGETGCGSGKPL